jgi:PAS domain S-box-containing protein
MDKLTDKTVALRVVHGKLVDERTRAECELSESRAQTAAIIDSAMDAIISVDSDQRVLIFNFSAEKMFGCSASEAIGQSLDRFIPSHFRAGHGRHVREFGKTGTCTQTLGVRHAVSALRANGEKFPVEASISQVEVGGQKLYTVMMRDITERKRAEAALRFQKSLLEAQSEASTDGILAVSSAGAILSFNNRFLKLWGLSKEFFEGKTDNSALQSVLDRVDRADDFRRRIEYLYQHPEEEGSDEVRLKNGTVLDRYSAPIRMGATEYYGRVWFFRDITERKQLEDQLRQSQKMEAIGQLAGGVAHDFNNLLTAINGYSDLALQRIDDAHPLRGYLDEIKKAGDRAANLTRQLLAFGRKQMLQPIVLNLNNVVGDMNKMFRRLIGEDINLAARLDPELKQIKADPGQIEQVLVNLVVNARDAMPQGGALTIETANFEIDREYVSRHVGAQPGNYVMLAISDTGTGMDEATRARIFEPFFTTKEKGKGTGLGLSTVYGIVKQSGGYIWVDSEPGQGTSFRIYLPQMESAIESVGSKSREATAPPGSETIMLVEDDDVVRCLARKVLEQAGYQVLDASGGEEAFRISRSHSAPIHLLLTDVVMPETSGKEVADRMALLRPSARVLFMSGYTDEAIVHHGIADSGVQFIQKPFSPNALATKVREVLDWKGHEGNV